MKIVFDRKQSPISIRDVKGKYLGEIFTCHQNTLDSTCPTCGHKKFKEVVAGYGLRISCRYWDLKGKTLRPKGQGGGSCAYRKRLKDVKALAVRVMR